MTLSRFRSMTTGSVKFLLATALIVAILRLGAPLFVQTDEGVQLEAAHRLVDGLGLTSTYDLSQPDDISASPNESAKPLTWYPPVYSLLVAGFLVLGVPLTLGLKILYLLATAIGWLGWGLLAAQFLGVSTPERPAVRRISVLVAIMLPLFLTPAWCGTDILLWAGVPVWVLLLCTSRSSDRPWRWIALCGVVTGLLYSIRYASLFLLPAGVLVLMFLAWPVARKGLRDATVFGATALASCLPVTIWNQLSTVAGSALPDWVARAGSEQSVLWQLREWLLALPTTGRMLVSSPILEAALVRVPIPGLAELAGTTCLVASAALPFLVVRSIGSTKRGLSEHLAIAVSLLPFSLILLLSAVQFDTGPEGWTGGHGPLSNGRYHYPLAPVGVLLAAFLLGRVRHGLLFAVALLPVGGFLLYFATIKPIQAAADASERNELASRVLGFNPMTAAHASPRGKRLLPSNLLYAGRDHSREEIKELYEEHPEAVFLVPRHYSHYVYDSFPGGPRPGVQLRKVPRLTPQFWRRAYTSRRATVYWVVDDESALDSLNLRQKSRVFRDTIETTSIWRSDLEAGQPLLVPSQNQQ